MEERTIIPLYVCDSIYALDKIADEPITEKDLEKCIDMLYNSASAVLKAYAAGDEEMEYISIRKSLKLFKHINEFRNLRNSTVHKALCFNDKVIKPRFVELQRSLTKRYLKETSDQHKLLLMSMKKEVPIEPDETKIDIEKVEKVDPELASLLKMIADKDIKYLDPTEISTVKAVNVDPFVIGLGRRKIQKPLYIATSFSQLEMISRSLKIPEIGFLECIERMCLILYLRKFVKLRDIELDYIFLSRYLSINSMLRQMEDYHEKYDDYRNIIVKVITVKSQYEEVRSLLIERYNILNTGEHLIKLLEKKENEISAQVDEIRKRKVLWISQAIKAV